MAGHQLLFQVLTRIVGCLYCDCQTMRNEKERESKREREKQLCRYIIEGKKEKKERKIDRKRQIKKERKNG